MSATLVVQLACGCAVTLGSGDEPPVCQLHHERRVSRVTAPAPRFTAVHCDVKGPLVRHA
jgi:hypothetical protein